MGTTQVGSLSWDAVFPDQAIVKIERGDATYNVQTITTKITNFSESGGAKTTESIAHFGGAFLTVDKPQEDFEVAFDVDVMDTTWDQVISDDITAVPGSVSGSAIKVVSGGEQDPYKVKLEWVSASGSEGYKLLYYNARGVTFERNSAADDRLTGTITFKLSPADASGSGQRYAIESSNLYDATIGSKTTGSYGAWEVTADTLFAYGCGSMI